jgi:hypothetical protein
MALVIGALLAFAVGLFATGFGLDRDRAFYPVVTAAYLAWLLKHRRVRAAA